VFHSGDPVAAVNACKEDSAEALRKAGVVLVEEGDEAIPNDDSQDGDLRPLIGNNA
jgi:hypothetical protein